MHTTQTLLDAYKSNKGISSDYGLAKNLGISKERISQYRRGIYCLGDDRARMIADELGLDRGEVILSIHAERSKKQHDEQTYLDISSVLKRLGGIAASFLVFALFLPAQDAQAEIHLAFNNNTHYAALAACAAAWLLHVALAMPDIMAACISHKMPARHP